MTRVRLLLLIAGCLIGFQLVGVTTAYATDVKVTCTAPTTNTDGTPITAAQGILTFNLYGGLSGQTKQKLVTGATTCSFTRTAVAFGTQEYQATAVVGTIESALSNVASIVVPPPTPNPPTNTAVVTLVAYEMRGSVATGDLRMVSVGYTHEGTPCMQTSATVGKVVYQQIDKKDVDLYNAVTKLPPVMWAKCG